MSAYNLLSDKQIEQLINSVYGGSISREVLPVNLYESIKERLNKGVFEGFGGKYSEFDTSTEEGLIMAGFEKNIAVFSGAKTFQQVNDMSNFLFDENGNKIPFSTFKEHANEIFDEYNKNWLQTEYNTAVSQAAAGRRWNEIKANEEALPLLEYSTIGDGRVRNEHKELDGIVLPVGHAFWRENFPPNDWNCRCIAEQLEEGEKPVTDMGQITLPEVPKLFKMNAGIDKVIFDESAHPYFTVDKRYKIALQDNFGLPFTPEVKTVKPKTPKVPKVPAAPTVQSAEAAKKRFTENTDFVRINELHLEIKEANAILKEERKYFSRPIRDREEYSQKVKEFNEKIAVNNKRLSEIKRLRLKTEKEVIDILKVDNPIKNINFEIGAESLKASPKLKGQTEAFMSLVSDKWQPIKDSVKVSIVPRVRANYNPFFNAVSLAKSDTTEIVIHELGHFLEHDRLDLNSRIMEFYNRRTAGDKIESLRNLVENSGYDFREVTKKDDFIDPYIGRFYNRAGSSEVLTMWFSEVFNNPVRMIEKDPEYFDFIYNLIREK